MQRNTNEIIILNPPRLQMLTRSPFLDALAAIEEAERPSRDDRERAAILDEITRFETSLGLCPSASSAPLR